MATVSPNMSLDIWDAGSDPYSHTQLAGNFNKLDLHDHTTGKGVQIPEDGIEDGAVTTDKIEDGAVTVDKLSGFITSANLDKDYIHPLGGFMWWWRPNNLTAIPTGWVICQGQSLGAAFHDFPGGGTINVPNVIGNFLYGVDLASVGLTGGSHTKNLQHSHTVLNHSHTVPAHQHTTDAHAHTVNEHDHGLGSASASVAAVTNTRVKQESTGNWKVWAIPAGSGDQGHDHAISGRTGSVIVGTNYATPNTSSVGLTTNDSTASTNNGLSSSFDIRPAWVGFLPLLKVKQ